MMTDDHKHAAKVSRQHTVYKTKGGQRVPGTTTITGVMDKPALVKWANGLGLQGIDSTKYVDELATIGTLAHYLIECHCRGTKPDLGDYTPNQISLAENSMIKWLYWQDKTGFKPTHNELILVSEKHLYGGTLDIVGTIGSKTVLVDIKTCKGIYGEHKTQVAGGYKILADEHNLGIDEVIITRVGRNEDEGFEEVTVSDYECTLHQKRFMICRELYEVNKIINRDETAAWKAKQKK
jgi:hypothetical protein